MCVLHIGDTPMHLKTPLGGGGRNNILSGTCTHLCQVACVFHSNIIIATLSVEHAHTFARLPVPIIAAAHWSPFFQHPIKWHML